MSQDQGVLVLREELVANYHIFHKSLLQTCFRSFNDECLLVFSKLTEWGKLSKKSTFLAKFFATNVNFFLLQKLFYLFQPALTGRQGSWVPGLSLPQICWVTTLELPFPHLQSGANSIYLHHRRPHCGGFWAKASRGLGGSVWVWSGSGADQLSVEDAAQGV